jgi:hypothetical protein
MLRFWKKIGKTFDSNLIQNKCVSFHSNT